MTAVAEEIRSIRAEALSAGSDVAGGGDPAGHEERARELFDRLTELQPLVDAAPPADRDDLAHAWSDARLDLLFVLSGGRAPTSLQLGHRLPGGA